MTDETVDLDEYRCLTAQKMIDIRRQRLYDLHINQKNANCSHDQLKELLNAGPAETWAMAAAKAAYLLELFAATADGWDSRRNELIAQTLSDLNRLSDLEKET